MTKMFFSMENKITPEQIEKARACKTVEELIAFAKENGIELTEAEATNLFAKLNPENGELMDSELEALAGGCGGNDEKIKCPECGSDSWETYKSPCNPHYRAHYFAKKCNSCGHIWDKIGKVDNHMGPG